MSDGEIFTVTPPSLSDGIIYLQNVLILVIITIMVVLQGDITGKMINFVGE